jgi:hypothetical protein
MPLPVIANVMRVVFDWVHPQAGFAKNITHWGGLTTPADLAAALTANVVSHMTDSVSSGADLATFSITPLDGSSATEVFANTWGGGSGGDSPIPSTATIVKLSTALRGQSFRGRIYLPFTDESAVFAGALTIDEITMGDAWTDYKDAMEADGWTMVVASYKLASAEPVTSLLVERAVATQRRRQDRLRP